jgi:hypothetical protein
MRCISFGGFEFVGDFTEHKKSIKGNVSKPVSIERPTSAEVFVARIA